MRFILKIFFNCDGWFFNHMYITMTLKEYLENWHFLHFSETYFHWIVSHTFIQIWSIHSQASPVYTYNRRCTGRTFHRSSGTWCKDSSRHTVAPGGRTAGSCAPSYCCCCPSSAESYGSAWTTTCQLKPDSQPTYRYKCWLCAKSGHSLTLGIITYMYQPMSKII